MVLDGKFRDICMFFVILVFSGIEETLALCVMRRASLVAGSQQLPDVQVVFRQQRVCGGVSVRNVRRRQRVRVLRV